ncbi:YciI family protein [Bacteroides sp. 519]|uniref:YciI family protein n=1 Tax=Bacteroides sp. 519 TaxID=2302937 RepID=UPI0013D58D1C|nr:YciI family protein [Bacteroides sp. 519]NDV56795.1 GTP cyclohydrolase [Bacteroides sp. 519]
MFIIILTYQKEITEVEKHLEAHREYLDSNYKSGNFIASGRQEPRVGGIILCRADNKQDVQLLIQSDPFYINEVAKYDIIQFEPTKYVSGFEKFL